MTGRRNISEYLHFDWAVHHYDAKQVFPADEKKLTLVSVPHDVGQALCYWVIKSNGEEAARTTVKPITEMDIEMDVTRPT
jgi:hypothetical protein